jgi:Zn-dependent protease with chaperone function
MAENSRLRWIRIVSISALAIGATAAASGCAPNSMRVVENTTRAWSTDDYVPPTDPRGVRLCAARVLARPEARADRVMQVGSPTVVVFSGPNVRSTPLGRLSFGDAVRVVTAADFVRIAPDGSPTETAGDMREYVGSNSGDALSPSWVEVQCGSALNGRTGWVPARALVSPLELAKNSQSLALARQAQSEGTGAKGFSEKMKRTSTVMKGGMGTPEMKDANYQAADSILDRIKEPMLLDVRRYPPFSPTPRMTDLLSTGSDLQSVDSSLAQQVSEVTVSAVSAGDVAEVASAGLGIAGRFGLQQAQDPAIRAGVEATKLLDVLLQDYPLTPVEERVIAREVLARAVGNTPVLPESHPVSAYVRWVGAWIAAQSTLPYPAAGLDFIVLDDHQTVNAFAVPGGPVLITTGMLRFLQSEHELAVLLGHEMGHVEERHSLKQLRDSRVISKLPALLSVAGDVGIDKFLLSQMQASGVPGDMQDLVIRIVKDRVRSALSDALESAVADVVSQATKDADQGIETAADLRGLSLAAAAGYEPAAIEPLLERLKAHSGSYGGASYSDARLDQARQVIPLLPSRHGGTCKTFAEGGGVAVSERTAANWSTLQGHLRSM